MSNAVSEFEKLRLAVKEASGRANRLQDKIDLLRAAYWAGTDSFTFREEAGIILGLREEP